MTDIVTPIASPVSLSSQQFIINSEKVHEIDFFQHLEYSLGLPPAFEPRFTDRINSKDNNPLSIVIYYNDTTIFPYPYALEPYGAWNFDGTQLTAGTDTIHQWCISDLIESDGNQRIDNLFEYAKPTETTTGKNFMNVRVDLDDQIQYLDSIYLDTLNRGEHDFSSNNLFLTNRSATGHMSGDLTYTFTPTIENVSIGNNNYLFIIEKYIISLYNFTLFHGLNSYPDPFAEIVENPGDHPTLSDPRYNTFGSIITDNTTQETIDTSFNIDANGWAGIFDSDDFKNNHTAGRQVAEYCIISRVVPYNIEASDNFTGITITFKQPERIEGSTRDLIVGFGTRVPDYPQFASGRFLGAMLYTTFNSSTFLDDIENALELDVSIQELRDGVTAP